MSSLAAPRCLPARLFYSGLAVPKAATSRAGEIDGLGGLGDRELQPPILPAAIRKGDVNLPAAAVRSGKAAVTAVGKVDGAFEVSQAAIEAHFTGLVLFGPRDRELDCLRLAREHEGLFPGAQLDVPACRGLEQDFDQHAGYPKRSSQALKRR